MIAVVLAGGSGTRFWPLSRAARPKQLIRLWGEGAMIAQTVRRLEEAVPGVQVLVVCGEPLLEETRAALPWLGPESFIAEPFARNTAPAIGLAAVVARARVGDEVVGVFPSDHHIEGIEHFAHCLELACEQAEAGAIVTMGIEPTRPETGYGYIRFGRDRVVATAEGDGLRAYAVDAFVEKPDRARAERYLEAGNYVWNSGMFFFKPSTLLDELARQLPAMHTAMETIAAALGTPDEDRVIREVFEPVERVSIDYGVMENARQVVVIPASFRWSDVGHWAAIEEVRGADADGNVVEADAVLEDVRNSVIYSEGTRRVIAAAGIEGLVVVDTPDALLIIPRDQAQDVRVLVERLQAAGRDDVL